MITGPFGISKTFSSILYQHLSNFIVDYRLKVKNPASIARDILNRPKTIYWSINMLNDTKENVWESMKKQLSPVELEYFESENIGISLELLKKAYNKQDI